MDYFDPDVFPIVGPDEWDSTGFSNFTDINVGPNSSNSNESFTEVWSSDVSRHLSESSFDSGYTSSQDLSSTCLSSSDFDPFLSLEQDENELYRESFSAFSPPAPKRFKLDDKTPGRSTVRDISGFRNFETSYSMSKFDQIDGELSKSILCKPLVPTTLHNSKKRPLLRRTIGAPFTASDGLIQESNPFKEHITKISAITTESPRKRSASPQLLQARIKLTAALERANLGAPETISVTTTGSVYSVNLSSTRNMRKKNIVKVIQKTTKASGDVPLKGKPVVLTPEQQEAYNQFRTIAMKPTKGATNTRANVITVVGGQKYIFHPVLPTVHKSNSTKK